MVPTSGLKLIIDDKSVSPFNSLILRVVHQYCQPYDLPNFGKFSLAFSSVCFCFNSVEP